MFKFLAKAARARWNSDLPQAAESALPLGCRLGAAVKIDDLPLRMLGDATLLALPKGDQIIEARGEVDLGQGATLHRMYLSDDLFLQINCEGSAIADIKIFQFHDTQTPPTRHALEAQLQPGGRIGAAELTFSGKRYYRVWGDEADHAPAVVFDEQVYKPNASDNFSLTHYAMLYQRDLPGDRRETLLIAVEDSGPNDYAIVTSIGLDLSPADLEII